MKNKIVALPPQDVMKEDQKERMKAKNHNVSRDLQKASRIWDTFFHMIIKFKLYRLQTKGAESQGKKLILTIFGNLRDFFLKYFDGLKKNAQIDKMNMKDIQIVENNIEFICCKIQEYKDKLANMTKQDKELSCLIGGTEHKKDYIDLGQSSSLNKMITQTLVGCLHLKTNFINKRRLVLCIQEQLLLSESVITQDWQSYKIPETSVHYILRNSLDNHYEYPCGSDVNKVLVSKTLCLLPYFFSKDAIIPGYTLPFREYVYPEEEKEADSLPKNTRNIIPSSHLFMMRKSLHKDLKGKEDRFEDNRFWLKFGDKVLKITTHMLSQYVSLLSMQAEGSTKGNEMEILGCKIYISEARRVNFVIDLRYLSLIIQNYTILLAYASTFCTNGILNYYFNSIIYSLKNQVAIILKLEVCLSIPPESDLSNPFCEMFELKSVDNLSKYLTSDPPVSPLDFNHQLSAFNNFNADISEIDQTQKLSKLNFLITGSKDNLNFEIEDLSRFIQTRPSPEEFIFMALSGLTTITEVHEEQTSKSKHLERTIAHTILKITPQLLTCHQESLNLGNLAESPLLEDSENPLNTSS
ncbi:unnamed protein product [Moneuplotes crassus]|uniref:Uncharacterized protein n=1 Tax=Euplotes crassus TaxID=5936 RepID=A0AAD1Y7M5_EUPCR|nr:unnamed protein product [Moneuplotes crassus]